MEDLSNHGHLQLADVSDIEYCCFSVMYMLVFVEVLMYIVILTINNLL